MATRPANSPPRKCIGWSNQRQRQYQKFLNAKKSRRVTRANKNKLKMKKPLNFTASLF